MGLFGKKEVRYLGVDIGAGGMKLVELLFEHGRYKLMTYGASSRDASEVEVALTENGGEALAHLKKLIKDAKVEARDVIASLPMQAVFTSIIAIPKVKDENETRALVERQARKLMPLPLEEMVLDYQILDIDRSNSDKKMFSGATENIRVLITGAQKDMVQTYTKLFQDGGLDLVSLETEPFALIHSLIGDDKSSVMTLDIGAFRTNMTIIENGIPFINRSIKVGGAGVTRTMSDQLGLDVGEAEQMKRDFRTDDGSIPKAVRDLFQPLVNEVSYAMNMYAKSDLTENTKVEKVILTGGSSLLPGLDAYLTEALNVRAFVGDPWARLDVNEGLRPVLDEIGPKFAVAIGLAMHSEEKVRDEKRDGDDKED